ncbi:hypothetical protein B296_00003170 [Ensete ventricosum]|uniref:Uncharacterized protein n=1 Tax=Ensete ventricosum TaxID=4639 RepID=A0A427ANA8_ENSVE|nr:hypothetical protein B296_00003170 [Ensete ventricosum]
MSRHCWFWPVCASSPAIVSSGDKVEHGWEEGAFGSGSAGWPSFVPEIFTASIAYHAVVLLHTVRSPCSEVRVLPVAVVVCRPYLCQVGRTIRDSSMPVSGQLRCVGSVTLEV